MPGHIEKKFIDLLTRTLDGYDNLEIITEKSKLPKEFRQESFSYEPDIVILNDGKITHIIEVETDPVRKALVGGACTCAYLIKKKFKEKPKLYFAIGELGSKYLTKFQAREEIIDEFFKDIFSDIKIDSQQKILDLVEKDLSKQ